MRILVAALSCFVVSCTGDILMDDPGQASLSIVTPLAGSTHTRDSLDDLGALVAAVNVVAEAQGPIDHVALFADGNLLGQGLQSPALFAQEGPVQIVAVGYAADGSELVTDRVDISIVAASAATCHEWLDLYQLDWVEDAAAPGVALPVRVTTPINGVAYRYYSNTNPRSTFFMDCELALALAQAAPILRERNLVEVLDIGVYNYRCIGGVGTPPDCPNGISEHAYARAIDLAAFFDDNGESYNVETDWIIDATGERTCDAPTKDRKDALLHGLACTMKAEGIWNIVLTPNYNSAHRDHFHVDLKPGSDFIKNERNLGDVSIPTVEHDKL